MGPLRAVLDRERWLEWAAALVAVLGAGAWFQPSVAGSDLWWHLASGRLIWSSGSIPHADPFSYTFAGRPWTNHEWLWDVLYWRIYQVHPEGVAWFNLALLFVIFALAYRLARVTSGSRLAAGAVLWLAAAASHWFFDIRPHLFTLLFVMTVLVLRDRAWAPFLWPPLVLVWVNLHGGFTFGLGVIGVIALSHTARASLAAQRLSIPMREWISVAACFVAMLCNPYGASILEYPIAYLDPDSPFRWIIEWLKPGFGLDPGTFEGRFWWLAILAAAGLWPALRRAPELAAIALVSFAMAATARRFIPLFALTSAPVAALGIAAALAGARARLAPLRHAAAPAIALGAAGLLALLLWRDVRLTPRLLDRWTEHWFYPAAALAYLQVLDRPERILNYYNWGGYMFLHAPEIRVFIDGRANTLYDEHIYTDYLEIIAAQPGYRELLRRHRIELVFVPTHSHLVQGLLSEPEPWKLLYLDRAASILVPQGSPLLERPLPEHPLAKSGHPDLELNEIKRLTRAGRFDEGIARLQGILERDPLLPQFWGELAVLHVRRGDLVAAQAAIDQAIDLMPQEARRMLEMEATALEEAGALDEAIATLRAAMPNGPFSPRDQTKRRLEALEQRRRSTPAPAISRPRS
jgi:tetratricopeptide (TPR) repeat protein